MKKIKGHLKEKGASEDELKQFEADAQTAAKKILGKFKDKEVFVGESFDSDSMYVQPPSLSGIFSLSTR